MWQIRLHCDIICHAGVEQLAWSTSSQCVCQGPGEEGSSLHARLTARFRSATKGLYSTAAPTTDAINISTNTALGKVWSNAQHHPSFQQDQAQAQRLCIARASAAPAKTANHCSTEYLAISGCLLPSWDSAPETVQKAWCARWQTDSCS